ncbi:ABC transporter ATP-binding protein [Pseudonocardia sp. CA-107938]|uniref:ABC transporter ATP-binding protein n=1 Tax=Pseudonocardia sp. CA-107938 TaxID=3240021 RepID=UPI003D8DEEDF
MSSPDHSPPDDPTAGARVPLATLRRLAPYVAPWRAAFIGGGLAALTATLAGLAMPLVTREIVDGPIGHGDLSALPWLVAGVVALGIAEAVLIAVRRMLVAGPANDVEKAMRMDLYRHLQRLPVSFHDGWPSGQLMSRISSDLTTIRWFVAFAGLFLVINVVAGVAGILVLVWLSPWIGLIVAVLSLPTIVATRSLERRFSAAARRAQDQAGDLATLVEESALGIRVLKSFGRGRTLARRFLADARELRGTELVKIRLLAWLWLWVMSMPELTIAVVLAIGAYGVAQGAMTLGTLVAVVTVLTYLAWPIQSLGWLLAEASNAAAATRRYIEVRDVLPDIVDPAAPVALPTPVRGELVLRDVRFTYPDGDRPVLDGVDLTVPAGETMALVGATGSGKTTLVALVPRLYDVTSGSVTVDGIDVRDLRLADLRRTVATAFEDAVLISASVRENVALGMPDASDEDIWEALRVASADGFVAALRWGLDTRIGEQGLALSGGQRQRLALARAVLGHPPVLVLDDPLSALDVHTEAEVEAALRRVLGPDPERGRPTGVTALVVAHRPSTVQLADRVAMLVDGRIAAVGTHRELLATDPAYRALMSSLEASDEEVRT